MRDDFGEEVKRSLAARVGYRCSHPECRALTSGPQIDTTKSLNVGVASHISAASPGGSRFNFRLTSEQRKSNTNGIWLCQNCAKLVDNDADRFSESLLHEWKRLAEEQALAEIGKAASIPRRNNEPVEGFHENSNPEILAQKLVQDIGDPTVLLIPHAPTRNQLCVFMLAKALYPKSVSFSAIRDSIVETSQPLVESIREVQSYNWVVQLADETYTMTELGRHEAVKVTERYLRDLI